MRRRFHSRQSGGPYVSVIFDKSISNPANITIEDNESVLDSILSQFRRCLCKKTAEGEVAICYLDDNNSNYYENGSDAILTGGQGDVMVNFPEFYYKYVKVNNNKFAYRFSLHNAGGEYKHVPRSLVGAYKGIVNCSKLYSWSGHGAERSISLNSFDSYATARGSGYQLIDFQQHCVIAFMLYAKYKNRNLQAFLGAGGAINSTYTGSSNSTGINDTRGETSEYVCGLGIEGVFGGIYEWVKGIIINYRIWTITDPDGSTRTVEAGLTDGWITSIAAENGPYFDMVPTAVGGSSSTYYSDYYWQLSSKSIVLARSCRESNARGGVACAYVRYDHSTTSSGFGSRLAFRGTIHKIQSSSEFKSLPLL